MICVLSLLKLYDGFMWGTRWNLYHSLTVSFACMCTFEFGKWHLRQMQLFIIHVLTAKLWFCQTEIHLKWKKQEKPKLFKKSTFHHVEGPEVLGDRVRWESLSLIIQIQQFSWSPQWPFRVKRERTGCLINVS